MTKLQRNILFYFSIIAFFAISSVVIIYAIGYKYDYHDYKFVKTGSLHIKVQTGAVVYVNNKTEGKTSLFGDEFSKNRLMPDQYEIRVQKDNYVSWNKTALISEGFLTDFPSIYLLKMDPLINITDDMKIASISVSDKNKIDFKLIQELKNKLVLQPDKIIRAKRANGTYYFLGEVKGKNVLFSLENESLNLIATDILDFQLDFSDSKIAWYSDNEVWIQYIKDTSGQPIKNKGDKELILKTQNIINSIEWFESGDHLFVLIDDSIQFIELDGRGGRNSYQIYKAKGIKGMAYNQNDNKLYIYQNDGYVGLEI